MRRVALPRVVVIGIAAAAFIALAGRLAARVRVVGPSMEPVLRDGDRVLVNEMAYLRRQPRPGDIVLARVPAVPGELTIKRVVTVPGMGGRAAGGSIVAGITERGTTAGYLLLGDNRRASTDSRHFGPVGRGQMRGRVWYRYWPPDRRGRISQAEPLLQSGGSVTARQRGTTRCRGVS